jgi:Lrp/AsnC family leucine-responsive transcriptional regulator
MDTKAKLTATDVKTLLCLLQDSRSTAQSISAEIGMSKSSVSASINRLREGDAIKSFTCLIDPASVGFHSIGYVTVRLLDRSEASVADFTQFISEHFFVVATYKILGEIDFLIKIWTESNSGFQNAIERINGHKAVDSAQSMLISDIILENVAPPNWIDGTLSSQSN